MLTCGDSGMEVIWRVHSVFKWLLELHKSVLQFHSEKVWHDGATKYWDKENTSCKCQVNWEGLKCIRCDLFLISHKYFEVKMFVCESNVYTDYKKTLSNTKVHNGMSACTGKSIHIALKNLNHSQKSKQWSLLDRPTALRAMQRNSY